MKSLLALSMLFLCSTASPQGKYRAGQYPVKQNPADYTIKVHISAMRYRPCVVPAVNTACGEGLYADAILNGKKFEIFGGVDKHQSSLMAPGGYMAMLPKKPRYGGQAVVGQAYYVLLKDRSAWPCWITGLSE
jgi:hypothetical protein